MIQLNPDDFNIIKISKNNGSFRLIYVPNEVVKTKLKRKILKLEKMINKYDDSKSVVGFRKDINCASAARQHIGYNCTIKMDLSNFFDTVHLDHFSFLTKLEKRYVEGCLIESIPRQGLPTSPSISNLAFIPVDQEICLALGDITSKFTYTRYADDLIISLNPMDISTPKLIITEISRIIAKHNFIVNKRKTKTKYASSGNRLITGIAVNDTGIKMSRKTRRKIRAAEHQGNVKSMNGLIEWGSCKMPNHKIINTILSKSSFKYTDDRSEISRAVDISLLFIRPLELNELYVYSPEFKTYAILNNKSNNFSIAPIVGLNPNESRNHLESIFDIESIKAIKAERYEKYSNK